MSVPVDTHARSRANYLAWYRGRAAIIGTTDPLEALHPLALTAALARLQIARQHAIDAGETTAVVDRIDGWAQTVNAELMGRAR